MSDIRTEVAQAFAGVFGREPHGVWSAPGRINLMGEHTDYNEGFALPIALGRRTVIALAPRDDGMLRVASEFADELAEVPLASLDPRTLSGWSSYVFGVAWALGRSGADLAAVPGLDAYVVSTVPVGAGLASSAALEASFAVALNDVWRLGLHPTALAAACQLAENEAAGAPTGRVDQLAALIGRENSAVLLDFRTGSAEHLPLGLAVAGLELLVIDPGLPHANADGQFASRRTSCEGAARLLDVPALRDLAVSDLESVRARLDEQTFRHVRHVVTENQRVLDAADALRAGDPTALGPLFDAAHASMRDDLRISTPEIDMAVACAQSNGAIGARLMGGGFGGSALALVPTGDVSRVQVALDGEFAEHGFAVPETFVVTSSDAAKREW
jgi:galactokinase